MQMENEHVIVFAGKKPPILGHRLEWFNLFSDAEQMTGNPPPEVPELPMPEIASSGPNAEQNGRAERQAPPSGASRLRRRRKSRRQEEREVEGGEEVGGYVEPDL
jgi:hypothetical protein